MTANLTTKLGQLVDLLTPDTTNTRVGVANASPTRTLDVTGTAAISSTLNFGGYAAEGTVTAAATTDLGTSTANRQSVTGSTTITSFGTGANLYRIIRFTGAPLLTYNATTLITPTKANIQAAPGDIATLTSDGSGNWTIISYLPYGGVVSASVLAAAYDNTAYSAVTSVSLTAGKWRLSGLAVNLSGGGTGDMVGGITSNNGGSTGFVQGVNAFASPIDGNALGSGSIPAYDVTLTATTTYYFNIRGGGATSTVSAGIRAERIF